MITLYDTVSREFWLINKNLVFNQHISSLKLKLRSAKHYYILLNSAAHEYAMIAKRGTDLLINSYLIIFVIQW